MIWDLHCHLSGLPGNSPEERISHLLKFADRMDISRVCVSMGINWSYDPDPTDLRRQNDDVLRAIKGHEDRVFGFAYLNPKHPQASLDELDRCVRDGPMVAVKLWVAVRCHSPWLDPIIDRAVALKALVLQHTYLKTDGNLPGESNPMDLAALAARHPNAQFVCGHTGCNWELGIRAIRDLPNITADLSGSDPCAGMTEMAVRDLGAERVLFGSDAGGRSFASQLGKVEGANISASAKKLILGANLARLLRPILASKGLKL